MFRWSSLEHILPFVYRAFYIPLCGSLLKGDVFFSVSCGQEQYMWGHGWNIKSTKNLLEEGMTLGMLWTLQMPWELGFVLLVVVLVLSINCFEECLQYNIHNFLKYSYFKLFFFFLVIKQLAYDEKSLSDELWVSWNTFPGKPFLSIFNKMLFGENIWNYTVLY